MNTKTKIISDENKIEKQKKCKHRNIYDGGKNSTLSYSKCLDCSKTIYY